jgi:cytochrome c6
MALRAANEELVAVARQSAGPAPLQRLAFGILLAAVPLAPSLAQAPAGAPKAAATAGPGDIDNGKKVFASAGCGSCHTLADAGAAGGVGPSLDGDASLSRALVVDRVTNGQGAMPSFGGQLSDKEIADVAAYVTHAAAK